MPCHLKFRLDRDRLTAEQALDGRYVFGHQCNASLCR